MGQQPVAALPVVSWDMKTNIDDDSDCCGIAPLICEERGADGTMSNGNVVGGESISSMSLGMSCWRRFLSCC